MPSPATEHTAGPLDAYPPVGCTARQSIAVMSPLSFTPTRISNLNGLRVSSAYINSRCVYSSRTGRFAFFASIAAMPWYSVLPSLSVHLPPNPPPIYGAITRTLPSGNLSTRSITCAQLCTLCCESHSVSCSPSHCATTQCGSIGTWNCNCVVYCPSTTLS